MSAAQKTKILARLSGDDPAARAALVRAATDHVLAQPIASFVDRESLTQLARAAATEANVALVLATHVRPGIDRQKARSTKNGETVGDLLPSDSEARLARLIDGFTMPNAKWAAGLVDPKLVNKLVAPVLQQTLLQFAKKLPIPGVTAEGGGAAGALGGALLGGLGGLAGGAGKLLDVGKSVVGGLSAEFEKKMQGVAKDFAENAADGLREALRNRIESEEGKKILREIVLKAHAKAQGVKVADVLADLDVVPREELEGLIAAVIAHNAVRTVVVDAVRAEIDAALAAEGAMTIGEWLARAGIREKATAVVDARADAVLRGFFGSAEFGSFLDLVLAD